MSRNPQAFPVNVESTNQHDDWLGMTLRDYFAAKALAGMLAADSSFSGPRWSPTGTSRDYQPGGGKWLDPEGAASQAYAVADAMLVQREKPQGAPDAE